MKKFLSGLLTLTLLLTIITPCIYADDDNNTTVTPPISSAVISLTEGEMDTEQIIYSAWAGDQAVSIQGISYDEQSNTLTINNFSTDKEISVKGTGTDFSLKVLGTNSIGSLHVFSMGGDDGSEIVGLTIKGTGTLSIDSERENAIMLESYFGGSTLRVGKDVTLKLKSRKDVITVNTVTEQNGSRPNERIIFENGQNVAVNDKPYSKMGNKSLSGYTPSYHASGKDSLGDQAKLPSDPDGIYTATHCWTQDENGDYDVEGYMVSKYIYSSTLDYYFTDNSFNNGSTLDMSLAEFQAAGYTFVEDEDGHNVQLLNKSYLDYSTYNEIYKDSNDKEYAVISHYDNGNEVYTICDITEIPEIPGEYFFTENTSVSLDNLEEVIEEKLYDNVYNYVIELPELNITPTSEHVHNFVEVPGRQASCTEEGNLPYYKCSDCDVWSIDSEGQNIIENHAEVILKKSNHDYQVKSTKKATLTEDGSITKECTMCHGEVVETISHPTKFTLSKTSYTYNGKVQKPSVTIKDSNGKTISSSNYSLKYSSGCKNVGEYSVTVTFKGNYSGSKKLTYKINPKGTSLSSLTAGSKRFTAKWKKQTTQTTGYEIQYSTNSKFEKDKKYAKIGNNKTVSKTVKKLAGKKKYYVRIRTYKTVNKKKYFSGWSKAKYITTKK